MAKLTQINTPLIEGGTEVISGQSVRLNVAGRAYRFLIHKNPYGELFLYDVRSGMKFGSLTPAFLSRSYMYKRMPNREAAQLLVDMRIKQFGAQRVLEVLDKHPTINPLRRDKSA